MAKDKKNKWCPLSGPIPYRSNENPQVDSLLSIIDRARMFWRDDSVYVTDGADNLLNSFAVREAPKAQRLYMAWDKLRKKKHIFFKLEQLSRAGQVTTSEHTREHYLNDVKLTFWKASQDNGEEYTLLEIISIIIIREAMEALNGLKDNGVMNMLPGQLSLYLEHISPDAIRGKKVLKGSKKSGPARRAQVDSDRGYVWADWQRRADEIWTRNPNMSIIRTAQIILKGLKMETLYEEQYALPKLSTIRQKIKK